MQRLQLISIGCVMSALLVGCHFAMSGAGPLPAKHEMVRDQLIVHSDFTMPQHHRLVDQLTAQRVTMSKKLDLAFTDEPIHVFLFDNDQIYYEFLAQRFPNFPARRALFVETDTRLSVYAFWGNHIAEDLRHEVTHGYLHAAVPNLPLWLDEGLAEYFEVQRGEHGLNRPHVELLHSLLQTKSWQPSLARLEQLATADRMTQQDYAESWSWVHFLLETSVERRVMISQYLADLRESGPVASLGNRLAKQLTQPEVTLVEHIEAL